MNFRDKRRKHRHWKTTVIYKDGQVFERTYIDRVKAVAFGNRQKRSPVVKTVRVAEVG